MQQQVEARHLTVPHFSVHVEGSKFVEIHFHDRVTPLPDVEEYLQEHGFRFYKNCNNRTEPRYGSRQSVQSWSFIQQFNREYGCEDLPYEAIPEKYRLDLGVEVISKPVYAPAAIAPPPTLVVPQPPPETKPMTRTKAASPGQLDFMAMFKDIFAIANEAVAELDEAAQRRAKLLEELAQWKDWRASWPGGEFRWVLFTSQIAMVATGLAIACIKAATQPVQPIEEDENLKKPEPLCLPELPPESTVEVEAQPVTTTETHDPLEEPTESQFILTPPTDSSPELKKVAKKTKAPKVRSKFPKPKLSGEPFWLDDDELRGTEPFIGCYAVLNGQVGLSFKGLSHDVEMRIDGRQYTALPGTFQPLELEPWMAERITDLVKISDAYFHLVSAEADASLEDDDVEERREELNFVYDYFVVNHGYIHQNKGLTSFNGVTDDRLYMLGALEQEDNDNGCYNKASIFYNRQQYPSPPPTTQLYHDDDPVERIKLAYAKCMDERGLRIDLDLIATLAGMEPDEAEEYLLDLGLAFRQPTFE